VVWLALLWGCAVEPARVFERDVVPVLEASCAAGSCHGVVPGAEEDGDVVDWNTFVFRVDGDRILDVEAARIAALRAANTDEDPKFSSLLRKPLATTHGGLPHFGKDNFPSTLDDGYRAIAEWIALESGGGEGTGALDELEHRFADDVQPMLLQMGCASGNCHGLDAAIPFRPDPGVGGEVSVAGTRANYGATLRMLSLDGDPAQSRLLKKMLPIFAGGITHKGGNASFLQAGDARIDPIEQWACAERTVRVGAGCAVQELSMVFVRGPAEPMPPFELDVWAPGTELYLAEGDEVTPLIDHLHDDPVDARDPAVDPTGSAVAFAMRTGPETGHDLWELILDTGAARQLTFDGETPLPGGGVATWRDPTYGPDGRIWAVSTRAGLLADAGELVDADLYAVDPVSLEIERRSWTPHIERKPVFWAVGEEAGGELGFTALRDALGGQERAHPFRFPPGLATEYHQHFGITPTENLFFDMRELADGRYVTVVGDLAGVWGGRLGVVDRNFGPELQGDASSLPFYAPPLARLDPDAASSGVTGRLYRDPVGLPDGRILASVAEGPLDLADPFASPDLAIAVIELADAPDGSGPRIAARTVLVDAVGLADFDPEPIVVRGPVPVDDAWDWDADATTGRLVHQGLPTIDAVLSYLPPSGVKSVTDGFVAVRLIESLEATAAQRLAVDPLDTRDGRAGADVLSLGRHGPQRILAELPLAEDGTFQAELPAGIAFRIQGLDAAGVAIGSLHNRWFDVHPGQTIKQGIQPVHYAALCAPCHGALDGDPNHVFVEPDLMTTASVTLSRYQGNNPRRPLSPPVLGDATRITVDFVDDVQPILDAHCAECHTPEDPAGGLSLTNTPTLHYTDAYESLLASGSASLNGQQWVDEPGASAAASFLVEVVTGSERLAPGTSSFAEAHPGTLTDAQILTLTRWIDLGATWSGRVP
jgi:hypothetical protein